MIETTLVDATNIGHWLQFIHRDLQKADFIGLDCETEDSRRHPGLNSFNNKKRHVFDTRRTTMTGFSLYPENGSHAYYLNLGHADVENRLRVEDARIVLKMKKPEAHWIAHNAPFEIAMFRNCLGVELERIFCTLQMAVSAYSPDEYDIQRFMTNGLGGFKKILREIVDASRGYRGKDHPMTPLQSEVFAKITAKESDSEWSYNGFVNSIRYGYGLKEAVRSFFGHKMVTYDEVLGDKEHMGQLTGAEVASYGADDSYWAVRLFFHLLQFMCSTHPPVVDTFFDQENPMVHTYSDLWTGGLKVNRPAITERKHDERAAYAAVLRRLRSAVLDLLPFPAELHDDLLAREPWYAKNGQGYRASIERWARQGDSVKDLDEALAARGPVSNAWAKELSTAESSGPNFSHYMPMRVLLYDLCKQKLVVSHGKVQSDGEARGKIKERGGDSRIIDCLNEIAGIEQRMKLYLTPYEQLVDPETHRLYPVVSSMLATRRLASRYPNPMQLAKRGSSTYVRGFFEADSDEHLVMSLDWSGVELVIVGELSGDPAFAEAYKQRPHADLHSRTAAALLKSELEIDVSVADFKRLPRMTEEEVLDLWGPKVLIDSKGQQMTPEVAYKFHRGNDGGKGANFNYWFSGALSTIGEKRGWSSDQMWAAVEAFRNEFPVAEAWRVAVIQQAQQYGYVVLPDGHRRTRWECTQDWRAAFLEKFDFLEDQAFISDVARKIQTRAKNQAVNAMVQGTCATLMKRSRLKLVQRFKAEGWGPREIRFMLPIHDEKVFSVHHKLVVPARKLVYGVMCDHPDLFPTLQLDASAAIGRTFEPWHKIKAPFGQIELDEAPEIFGGGKLDDDGVQGVVEYLMHQKVRMAA